MLEAKQREESVFHAELQRIGLLVYPKRLTNSNHLETDGATLPPRL